MWGKVEVEREVNAMLKSASMRKHKRTRTATGRRDPPETPPPSGTVREGTAQQRADNARASKGEPENSKVHGFVLGPDRKGDEDKDGSHAAGAAAACDEAPGDERRAVLRSSANKVAGLEEQNSHNKDTFHRKVLVRLAPCCLKRRVGNGIARRVPSNIVEGPELIRDLRYRSCEDRNVQCRQENRENEADSDKDEAQAAGIVAGWGMGEFERIVRSVCAVARVVDLLSVL